MIGALKKLLGPSAVLAVLAACGASGTASPTAATPAPSAAPAVPTPAPSATPTIPRPDPVALQGWLASHGHDFAAVEDALTPLEISQDFNDALTGCASLEKQLIALKASALPTPDAVLTEQLSGAVDQFLQAARQCQDAARRQDRAGLSQVNGEFGVATQNLLKAAGRLGLTGSG